MKKDTVEMRNMTLARVVAARVLLILFSVLALQAGLIAARAEGRGEPAVQSDGVSLYPLEIHTPEMVHGFQVELARTSQERARGLMYRTEMAADHGMLFIFEDAGARYFWMKDTPLPLDILFVDAQGKIIRIAAKTKPFSEDIIPSFGDALYVLELNAGTSERLGISIGDQIRSSAMSEEKDE